MKLKKLSEIQKQWLLLAFMIYVTFVSMMWKWGLQGDMMFWMTWSKQIYNHGFSSVYDSGCNYLPAYLYFLYFHTKIQGNLIDIQDNLYTIKYYTFIFDMLGAFLAVWFVRDKFKKVFYFLILLFNVAYIYNTVMWAQVDAIYTFFGFAALIAALERKIIFSILLLFISLNFKLQAIVFIPVIGLILLPQIIIKEGFLKLTASFVVCILLEVFILFPFIIHGRLHQIMHVISGSVGYYPYPAVGAFNVWSIFLPSQNIESMQLITDDTKFGFISYKNIGFLLFSFTTFLAIFPLVKYLYKKYINKESEKFSLEKVFLITGLVALNFYFFNTQMHERYAHPVILLIAAFSFLSKKIFPLLLASVAYFLNLEGICWYLNLHIETYKTGLLFNPKLVAVLYLLLIGILYYHLYTEKHTKTSFIEI